MSEWRKNHGRKPGDAAGKRVVVELRTGEICGELPQTPTSPAGWAVEPQKGAPGVRWTLEGHPFDVIRYRIL